MPKQTAQDALDFQVRSSIGLEALALSKGSVLSKRRTLFDLLFEYYLTKEERELKLTKQTQV